MAGCPSDLDPQEPELTAFPAVAVGRHRRQLVVLPESPDDEEKVCYSWRSLPFLASSLALSSLCLVVAQICFEVRNAIALPFLCYTGLFLIYQLVSLPVNFGGRGFDLDQHQRLVA